jgi:flavodoxin I
MKALVIYQSYFGNTQKIAEAIARGLEVGTDVVLRRVEDVVPEEIHLYDLVVFGSATRGFRPASEMMTLIKNLPDGSLNGIDVASFDTRIALSSINSRVFRFIIDMGGYAAAKILRALVRKGGTRRVPPEGFFVLDTEGPLKENELLRAESWAADLVEENVEVAV